MVVVADDTIPLPSNMLRLSQEQLIEVAESGDKEAQFRLGLFYETQSKDQDRFKKSAYWYDLASKQNHRVAQYNLGVLFMTGAGVGKDTAKALKFWLKAARAGHSHAQFNVARGYLLGLGLPENNEKAKYWFNKAAAQGEPKSKEVLKELGWEDEEQFKKASNKNSSNTVALKPPATKGVLKTQRAVDVTQRKQPEKNIKAAPVKSSSTLAKEINVYVSASEGSSVLAALPNRKNLTVFKSKKAGWLIVESSTGFTAWVYKKFVKNQFGYGKVIAENVIARSKPIVNNDTKFNVFRKGEVVRILKDDDKWYKVVLPPKFKAWVRKSDWYDE